MMNRPHDIARPPRPPRAARAALTAATCAALAACLAAPSGAARAADPPPDAPCAEPGEFPDETLGAWKVREFSGTTDYSLVQEEGRRTLAAETDGQASVLYREREVDLAATPMLTWSWKVDGVYAGIDERTKSGDDYPARVYVVLRTGVLPWSTLALNYVWASGQPRDSIWKSPYTDKARMIAVRSGPAGTGGWACERRDVVADFEAAFGRSVDSIDGYAIMVDGDNGDRRAVARFGRLGFEAR